MPPLSSSHEALLAELDPDVDALRERGEVLHAQLAALLRLDPALKLHSTTMRVKSRASLAAKLARPDRTYGSVWDVTDLVGIRVITYFEDGVDRVGEIIEAHLPVELEHSTDKRGTDDTGRFGYRSLHYVCRLGHGRARAEIQVRTMLEHAWAEIEHDLGYKTRDSVPAAARRRLSRLAGMLELADHEFVAIRRELADYARALPERIATAGDAVRLDWLSLATLLDQPDVRALDEVIAASLDRPLGDEPFFPDYLLRMLRAAGLSSVGAVRSALDRRRDALLALVAPYFRYAAAAWRLSPARMPVLPRGYSLFFLAHALVLDASPLGLVKVERLAQLYQELDYPDDRREALRVASELVAALTPAGPAAAVR